MNKTVYLIIAIATLVALGILAISLFLLLRKGPKVERAKCAECADLSCPLARALEEKRP